MGQSCQPLGQLGQHVRDQCPSHPPVPASKPRNSDYLLKDLISCISQLQSGGLDSWKSGSPAEAGAALQLGKWLCSSPAVTFSWCPPSRAWHCHGAMPSCAGRCPGTRKGHPLFGRQHRTSLGAVSDGHPQESVTSPGLRWDRECGGTQRDLEVLTGQVAFLCASVPSGTAPKDQHVQQRD